MTKAPLLKPLPAHDLATYKALFMLANGTVGGFAPLTGRSFMAAFKEARALLRRRPEPLPEKPVEDTALIDWKNACALIEWQNKERRTAIHSLTPWLNYTPPAES